MAKLKCRGAGGKKRPCTKNNWYPKPLTGKRVNAENQTSTMLYFGQRCKCTKGKGKSPKGHYRCPPGWSTGKATSGGIPVCKGNTKPHYVKGYSRCKPKRGGCNLAKRK